MHALWSVTTITRLKRPLIIIPLAVIIIRAPVVATITVISAVMIAFGTVIASVRTVTAGALIVSSVSRLVVI